MKSWRCWIYAECFQTTEDELFDSNLYKSSSKFSWQPVNFLSHFDEWHEHRPNDTKCVCAVSYVSSQLWGAIWWLRHQMSPSCCFLLRKKRCDGHRMPQVTTIHCEDLPSCKVVKDFDFPTPSQTKEIGLNLEGSRRTPRRSTSTCCHSIWIENGLPMGYVEYLPCDNVFHSNGNWLGIFGQSMTKLYQILILSECVWRYLDSEWFWFEFSWVPSEFQGLHAAIPCERLSLRRTWQVNKSRYAMDSAMDSAMGYRGVLGFRTVKRFSTSMLTAPALSVSTKPPAL